MGERGEERGGEAVLGGEEAGGRVCGSGMGWDADRLEAEFEGCEPERMSEEEREGGEETHDPGDAAGSGDVVSCGRDGGRGEAGGQVGIMLWLCCCDQAKADDGEDGEGGGSTEVTGGCVEGERGPE